MNKLTTEHTPDNIIATWIDDHQDELVRTADYIFRHPELAYQETLLPNAWQIIWKARDLK